MIMKEFIPEKGTRSFVIMSALGLGELDGLGTLDGLGA
jgi:hypothetical protein